MKQFTRTTHLALLGGALLGAAWLPSVASAKPFPKRGYILDNKGNADIGRRASEMNAQRAAMRMLVRLTRSHPQEVVFKVNWNTTSIHRQSKRGQVVFRNNTSENSIEVGGEDYYLGVTKRIIYALSRRGGTFQDLPFYGAWAPTSSVKVDLGVQKSYDVGNRATMRFLSQRLGKSYPSTEYKVGWSYPSFGGNLPKIEVNVEYNPVYDRGSLLIQQSSDSLPEFYTGVKRSMIVTVGRRDGRFDDVVRLGGR